MCPNCRNAIQKNKGCYQCNNCDLTVYDGIPILVKNYEQIRSHIDEAKLKGKQEWYESSQEIIWQGPYRHHLLKRKKYVESVLVKYNAIKPVNSLLDLGCGDGANFEWLNLHTKNLYVSDYNITRLLRAKGRSIAKEIALVDITDYAASDNSLDVVFFNHVLEHIPNDNAALSEVYRILKPGGICVLGVPNEGSFWWQLAYKLQPKSLETTDHVHFYTINSLSEKIKKCGFTIREIKKLGWGIPHWDLDSRLRGYKILDDLFEIFGKIFIPNQASSLYFVIEK
jgi:ubiquinone/menaquinone biosynthesis C-methylase UbiE